MSHPSRFLASSSNTSRPSFLVCFSCSCYVSPTLYCCATQAHICAPTSSSSRLLELYLFLLSGRSRSPTRNRVSALSRNLLGGAKIRFYIPISSLSAPLLYLPLSPYFSALAFPFLLYVRSFTSFLFGSRQASPYQQYISSLPGAGAGARRYSFLSSNSTASSPARGGGGAGGARIRRQSGKTCCCVPPRPERGGGGVGVWGDKRYRRRR